MSNTVSSANLILRRVAIYTQDVVHILRHELPDKQERMGIEEQIKSIRGQFDKILQMLEEKS